MKTWMSGVTIPCSLSFCCWWRGSSYLQVRRFDPANYWRSGFISLVVPPKFHDSIWSITPPCGRCWHCAVCEWGILHMRDVKGVGFTPIHSDTWLPIHFTDNNWWYMWHWWKSNWELYWVYVYISKYSYWHNFLPKLKESLFFSDHHAVHFYVVHSKFWTNWSVFMILVPKLCNCTTSKFTTFTVVSILNNGNLA